MANDKGAKDKRPFRLDVQGVKIEVQKPRITVRDAIVAAGFDPNDDWIIILKVAGQAKVQVGVDYLIDLTTPGLEKLRLTPRQINNGESQAVHRRDFSLLPKDDEYLNTFGIWETVVDQARRWLLIHDHELPDGYTSRSVTIAIEIPSAYPAAELDMFYCYPAVSLADGRQVPTADATVMICGRTYQRWSRHRPSGEWDPCKDDVRSHLALVEEAIHREIEK